MSSLLQRIALLVLLAAVTGCSTINDAKDTVSGWVGGGSGTLETTKTAAASGAASQLKYAATLRVANYVDQRKVSNPRYLGQLSGRVSGLSGNELLMDQDVASIATGAIKKRFDTEGFQVMEGTSAANAVFEVTGVVKELTLNIKERDEISIAIETTLKDVATGKVVWSGLVTEKNSRFAGVSGNSKDDVMAYLNKELRIASTKAVEAIGASLMASRPDLFNLTPGTKPIPGVTVYVAPSLPKAAPVAVPSYGVQPGSDVPVSTYRPHASDANGLLLVNTNPPRAKVYLDGVYYGMSPLRLEIEPGIHAISVKLAGYNMVTEKVSVRRGDNTEIELNLEH
ncbi:MAG: PEGA domain-containing protein [Gallionella sp.]|nr:PEGA domain-containing protein [Gallionella sp.]